MKKKYIHFMYKIFFLMILKEQDLSAENQPYSHSFDLAAGGTTLTRATQEGMMLGNPALLPYGGKFLRWLGLRTDVMAAKESLKLTKKSSDSIVSRLFSNPVHGGMKNSISFITQNGGMGLFTSFEPDIQAYKRGDEIKGSGLPEIRVEKNISAGGYGALALRTPFPWLSFGSNLKYLFLEHEPLYIDLLDPQISQKVSSALSVKTIKKNLSQHLSSDLGMLIFIQNSWIDYRFGFMAQDIMSFTLKRGSISSDKENLLPRSYHGGLGITFHNLEDSLHFSFESHDILNVYKTPLFKRIHLGSRFSLRGIAALACGILNGFPSYGTEINLYLLRLGLSSYVQEFGLNYPGQNKRTIYAVSLATGFDF